MTTLEWAQALVRPGIESALSSLHPDLERMGRHAMGGKAVRPALAFLSAQASGAAATGALDAAVAVELVHMFSLVHDDIMDGDETRRHRPSTWREFGVGPAVLAGDALLTLAGKQLEASGGHAGRLLRDAVSDLICGQATDLAFESRPWTGPDRVSLADYRRMSGDKTGALMRCSMAIGALLAGATAPDVDTLGRVGFHLGLAFQSVDDHLGVFGDPAVTGKPASSDLARRKKTFPVLSAVDSGTRAGVELARLLTCDELDACRAAQLVWDAGGCRAAEKEAAHQLDTAIEELSRVPMTGATRAEIIELAHFLGSRHA